MGRSSRFFASLSAWVLLSSTGCFYTQGIRGGLEILLQRRPIEKILADPGASEDLVRRLSMVDEARRFAVRNLGLPDNGSYRHYTDLDRPYAVWNVVAAPELSVDPVLWCFPFAGCVSYRGYFSERRAARFAEGLREKGFDVQVSGATTYSTLGWFKDPVLSTFVDLPPATLAGILFHELSHQRFYLKGDTVLNESFATVVEEEGVRKWLLSRGESDRWQGYQAARRRQGQVAGLLRQCRSQLQRAFQESSPEETKRRKKEEIFLDLRRHYRTLRQGWGGYSGYDAFFEAELNNAHLAAVAAYHDQVPALRRLLELCSGDLPCFYRAVESLGALPAEARRSRLAELAADSADPDPLGPPPPGRLQSPSCAPL